MEAEAVVFVGCVSISSNNSFHFRSPEDNTLALDGTHLMLLLKGNIFSRKFTR